MISCQRMIPRGTRRYQTPTVFSAGFDSVVKNRKKAIVLILCQPKIPPDSVPIGTSSH